MEQLTGVELKQLEDLVKIIEYVANKKGVSDNEMLEAVINQMNNK